MQRGEIYRLTHDAVGKRRPVVIVSRDDLNNGHSVVVVPFFSEQLEKRTKLKWCVPFSKGDGGLDKDCVAKADEIMLLRKAELDVKRGKVGRLNAEQMARIVEAIRYVIRDDSLAPAQKAVPRSGQHGDAPNS